MLKQQSVLADVIMPLDVEVGYQSRNHKMICRTSKTKEEEEGKKSELQLRREQSYLALQRKVSVRSPERFLEMK